MRSSCRDHGLVSFFGCFIEPDSLMSPSKAQVCHVLSARLVKTDTPVPARVVRVQALAVLTVLLRGNNLKMPRVDARVNVTHVVDVHPGRDNTLEMGIGEPVGVPLYDFPIAIFYYERAVSLTGGTTSPEPATGGVITDKSSKPFNWGFSPTQGLKSQPSTLLLVMRVTETGLVMLCPWATLKVAASEPLNIFQSTAF